MKLATQKWFRFLNEEREIQVLEEALENLGLPPVIIANIRTVLPDTSGDGAKQRRLAQEWIGKLWKSHSVRPLPHGAKEDVLRSMKYQQKLHTRITNAILEELGDDGKPTPQAIEALKALDVVDQKLKRAHENLMGMFVSDTIEGIFDLKSYGQVAKAWKSVQKQWKRYIDTQERWLPSGGASMLEEFIANFANGFNEASLNRMFTNYRSMMKWLAQDPRNFPIVGIEAEEDEETGRVNVVKTGPFDWAPSKPGDTNPRFPAQGGVASSEAILQMANEAANARLSAYVSPDQIIHDFGNGFKWWNTRTNSCNQLVTAKCGHCGGDDRVTELIILIKQGEKDLDWSCYTTLGYESLRKEIMQIKGNGPYTGNVPPDEKLWPYIDWFIENEGVREVSEDYNYLDDERTTDTAEEFITHLAEAHPDVEVRGLKRSQEDLLRAELREVVDGAEFTNDVKVGYRFVDAYVDPGTMLVSVSGEISVGIPLAPAGTPDAEVAELKPTDTWSFNAYRALENPISKPLMDAMGLSKVDFEETGDRRRSEMSGQVEWYTVDTNLEKLEDRAERLADKYNIPLNSVQIQTMLEKTPARLLQYKVKLSRTFEGTDAEQMGDDIDTFIEVFTSIDNSWEEIEGTTYLQLSKEGYTTASPLKVFYDGVTEHGDGELEEKFNKTMFMIVYDDGEVKVVYHGGAGATNYFQTGLYFPTKYYLQDTFQGKGNALALAFGGGSPMPPLALDYVQKRQIWDRFLEELGLDGAEYSRMFGWAEQGTWRLMPSPSSQDPQPGKDELWFRINFLFPPESLPARVEGTLGVMRLLNANSDAFNQAVYEWTKEKLDAYLAKADPIEEQILQTQALLREVDDTFDLRLYKMFMRVKIQKDFGGQLGEVFDQIRMIPNVTVVIGRGSKSYPEVIVADIEVKFGFEGIRDADYIADLLEQRIATLEGVDVMFVAPEVEWIYSSIQDLNETMYGVPKTAPFPTPSISLQHILEDWMQWGVMDYDQLQTANHMNYHTMVPVSEFEPWMERWNRAPQDGFIKNEMYKSFIANGPTQAVVVAFGKNGVIKILANQEVVIFAKQAGLEEVPAIFQFQRQA